MKKKRILAMLLAVTSCLSLAVSASAANTVNRKATDFRDFDKSAWYAEAVSAAVDNGLLYGKSSSIIDPNGDMTRAEMAAIINRSFGCYKAADISQYKDVAKSKWYYKDVALAVQMGTYNGRSSSTMAPDAPISRQEAMTVVARALELDYDSYSKTDLSVFSDRSEISNWALPYVRAMVGADYIHGRGKILAPLDNITRAEFAQIFHNIIGTYIVSKGTYDKDIKGSVLIRTDDVTFKNMTVDGDLIIGCGDVLDYLHIPYTTKERTRSMENEKDYQPDILNFLEKIVQRNTLAYKEDFDVDKEILWNSAQESSLEHRSFLWMSRPCGTWCVPERETYLQDSRAYKTWTFYADQPNGIKAYRVVVDGVRDGKLAGKVIHLDYAKQVQRVVKSALPIAKVQYRDKDEYFCESSHETFIHRVLRLEENTHDIRYVPECEAELQRLLSLEHQMEKQDKRPRRTKSVTMQR